MKSRNLQKKEGSKSSINIILAIFLALIAITMVTAAQALAIWICVKVGFL